MRVLRVYITGSSPVTCTKLKTRMKSKKLRFHAGFSLFFLKNIFMF
nr:MAG TPA: hypothetical protein [Caudoviricetes sp.]